MRTTKCSSCGELTLQEVKHVLELEIKLFEMDFDDKDFGVTARLLHKHYKKILSLLEHLKKGSEKELTKNV